MRLVLMGPPGAGKGTQAALLKESLQIPHISTGDIFRKKMADGSELGAKVKGFVEKGELVPDAVVIEMVKERLQEADTKSGFILDGFPRTRTQAEALSECLQELNIALDFVLDFQVDEEVIIKRLSSRRVCKACGEVFNVIGLPPKQEGICDNCGGELIHRKDDEENTVRNRLNVYKETAEPLIDYYKASGLWHPVDSSLGRHELADVLDKLFQSKR